MIGIAFPRKATVFVVKLPETTLQSASPAEGDCESHLRGAARSLAKYTSICHVQPCGQMIAIGQHLL